MQGREWIEALRSHLRTKMPSSRRITWVRRYQLTPHHRPQIRLKPPQHRLTVQMRLRIQITRSAQRLPQGGISRQRLNGSRQRSRVFGGHHQAAGLHHGGQIGAGVGCGYYRAGAGLLAGSLLGMTKSAASARWGSRL